MIVSTQGDARDQTLLFGAGWCADCRRAKSWLRRNGVPFVELDTDADVEARERAVAFAGGRTAIPVVVTPEGAVLVEPTTGELASTLANHRHRTHSPNTHCR